MPERERRELAISPPRPYCLGVLLRPLPQGLAPLRNPSRIGLLCTLTYKVAKFVAGPVYPVQLHERRKASNSIMQLGSRNHILVGLSLEAVRSLDLKPVKLCAGDVVYRGGQSCNCLTFIEAGVVGISVPFHGSESADVLSLGYESALGLHAVAGQTDCPHSALVRNTGWAYQATIDRALAVMQNHPSFAKSVLSALGVQWQEAFRMPLA